MAPVRSVTKIEAVDGHPYFVQLAFCPQESGGGVESSMLDVVVTDGGPAAWAASGASQLPLQCVQPCAPLASQLLFPLEPRVCSVCSWSTQCPSPLLAQGSPQLACGVPPATRWRTP